jgi:hypothetical protein
MLIRTVIRKRAPLLIEHAAYVGFPFGDARKRLLPVFVASVMVKRRPEGEETAHHQAEGKDVHSETILPARYFRSPPTPSTIVLLSVQLGYNLLTLIKDVRT